MSMTHREWCVDTIAHMLVSQGGPADDAWEDYPGIGEHDWADIIARAAVIRADLEPSITDSHTAYQALAAATGSAPGRGV